MIRPRPDAQGAMVYVSRDRRYHRLWRRAANSLHSSRTKHGAANMPTPELPKNSLSSSRAVTTGAVEAMLQELDPFLRRGSGEHHTEFSRQLKGTVRSTTPKARVMPKPSLYPPARLRAVRELIGASQEVFAQLLAVSPMTIRSWEQGSRQPSPIARCFLDEIAVAPDHFRGRILTAVEDAGRANRARSPTKSRKTQTRES